MVLVLIGSALFAVGTSLFFLRKDDPRYVVYGPLIQYRLFGGLLVLLGLFTVAVGCGMRSILGIPITVH